MAHTLLLAAAVLCLLTATPALASKPSLKWSGLSTEGNPSWSIDKNWAGDHAPTAKDALATLEFPQLSSCASEEHPCYESDDDVSELSAEALHIDDGDSYELWGDELALGAGGLTASPSGSKGEALDVLELPLQLSATQKWSLSGRGNGEINGLELVEAGVTGATSTNLTLELGKQAVLALEDSEVEAGPVSIAGASSAKAGFENGLAVLDGGDIDAVGEQPVELSHILFSGSGEVGSLTTKDAELAVGDGIKPAGGIEATSVTLDAGSEVAFEITGGGDLAESDYSQLTSEGAVDLASAKLAVDVGPPAEKQPCPTLTVGQTYTFVSTFGALSGVFANAPDNGAEIPIHFAESCTPAPLSMRISYQETGEVETVTGTVETEPVVTESPVSLQVTEGESAVFNAAATGAASVQWQVKKGVSGSFEDDTSDPGNTTDTLTVEHATVSENGYEYRAVFKNDAGEQYTTAAVLGVEPRVVITESPASMKVTEGESAMFKVAATGAASVQWQVKKGAAGSFEDDTSDPGNATDTLTVEHVTPSASGYEYRAVFKNGLGKEAVTAVAALTVEPRVVITESPVSMRVTEGESAVFKAAATGVKSVQWQVKKGAAGSFEDDANDPGNTEDTLTVEHASASENGYEYRAVFKNGAGEEAVTAVAALTVESKPVSTQTQASTNSTEGAKHREETAKGGVLSAKEGSPDATIASTSLTVSASGAFVVKVECPVTDTSCAGTITIRTLHAVLTSVSSHKAKQKATVLTLAAGSFTVAGGQSKALTLHLSAAGKKLLARTHVLSARATIVAHDPTDGANTGSTVVTLRAAKPKHGKG